MGQITTTNANGDPCDQYFNILLNPQLIAPFSNDFRIEEDSPCIDAGDPTRPLDPDQTVSDMGAIAFFQSPIFVSITSQTPVIMIPAGGGSFQYTVKIWSVFSQVYNFDFWTEVIMPDSSIYGPILSRSGINIPPGDTLSRTMSQYIPAAAPPGFYYLVAIAGFLPDSVVTSAQLPFMKLLGGDGPGYIGGWKTEGWDTPENDSPMKSVSTHFTAPSPNPFNPGTVFHFALDEAQVVKLAVYNILGREVAVVVEGMMPAGEYDFNFDASRLPAGIYFAELASRDTRLVQKLLLLK